MHIIILFTLLLCCFSCAPEKCSEAVKEREKNAFCDLQYVYSTVEMPDHPLYLEDIINIAWENNWDTLTRELEWEVQREVATREMLKMLPSLNFNGEKSFRNKSTASTSLLPATGIITPPSIGSSQHVKVWDMTFTFRVLDFALAYYRSQAEGWRALGVYTQYARLKQTLILEVYRSYWRVVAAQWAMERTGAMLALITEFTQKFEKDMDLRYISRVPGLRIEDQLLGFQLQFYNFDLAYATAKAELAALMGIPPDVEFELAPIEVLPMPCVDDVEELERLALQHRPELYGADFNEHLAAEQVRLAIIPLLPNLEYFKSYQNNFDRFLVHHRWIVTGMRAAWDLLAVPQKVVDIKSAKINRERAYVARLALSVGILTQVHIAYNNYQNIARLYDIREGISKVRDRLSKATDSEFSEGEFNEVEAVLARANALQAEIDFIRAYGEMQTVLEQLNNSIGLPLRYSTVALPGDCVEVICEEIPPPDGGEGM